MYGPGGGDARGVDAGLIPRAARALFEEAAARGPYADASLSVSLCEIYCDRIRDLGKAYVARQKGPSGAAASGIRPATATLRTSELASRATAERHGFGASDPHGVAAQYTSESLELREDNRGQVYVKDLALIPVQAVDEVLAVIDTGFRLRATHDTRMNQTSSRSHTLLTFHVTQKDRGTGQSTVSLVHFVDLAGSERLAKVRAGAGTPRTRTPGR
jgi:hypothetical protein